MRRGPLYLAVITLLWPAISHAEQFGFAAGDRLPNFVYYGPDNIRHNTVDLRGRWLIFKRGASWCAPCVAERSWLNQFMLAHTDVAVLMGVVPPPPDLSTAARVAQMQRDIEFNRSRSWKTDQVVVIESRIPSASDLPAPPGFELLPLTILVDKAGIIKRTWMASQPGPNFDQLDQLIR